LLHITKESALLGDVSHCAYPESTLDPEEKEKISRSLGPINKVGTKIGIVNLKHN